MVARLEEDRLDESRVPENGIETESRRFSKLHRWIPPLSWNWLSWSTSKSTNEGRGIDWNRVLKRESWKALKARRWRGKKWMDPPLFERTYFIRSRAFRIRKQGWTGVVDVFRQWAYLIYGRWWWKETKRVTNDPANESSGNAFGRFPGWKSVVHLDVD